MTDVKAAEPTAENNVEQANDSVAKEPLPVGTELDLSADACAAIAKASEEIDYRLALLGALREEFLAAEARSLAEVAAARQKRAALLDAAVKSVGGDLSSQAWNVNYVSGKMTRRA